jgi:hypothetical protein
MKRQVISVTLGMVLLSGGLAGEPQARSPGKAEWQTDYDAAKALARRSGKPIFLVFR